MSTGGTTTGGVNTNHQATGGSTGDGAETGGTKDPGTGGLASGGTVAGSGASAGTGATGGTAQGGTGGSPAGGGGAAAYNCSEPTTLPHTYQAVVECVIEPGCQSSICHGGEVPLLLIDTWEDFPRRDDHSPYDALSETLLNYTVDHCYGAPLVDPGAPDNSALIMALTRQCEDPDWGMPDGCLETPCIPQDYVDFVADWISEGAPM